ncbi:MAG: hypothetical protein ACPHO4_01505, partial [Longimicrobiales bacterium]
MVLAGTGNDLIEQLADSGRIDLDELAPGEGLIQLVPQAFGSKPALVLTGADEAGAERALEQLAIGLPNLADRGKDRPTVDDVERGLWDALAGHSPLGQAGTGMYKLARIAQALSDEEITSASVLMSVEDADAGLASWVEARAVDLLGTTEVDVSIDNRNVLAASTTIYEESLTLPSEVDRFR